jgi:small-conductance mechanosensitive channel
MFESSKIVDNRVTQEIIPMSVNKIRNAAIAGCLALLTACAFGQKDQGAPVNLEGKTLFRVRARLGPFSPEDRAHTISSRLLAIAKDRSISINEFALVQSDNATDIVVRDQVIATVSDEDARLARTPRNELVASYLSSIQSAIAQRRNDYSLRNISVRALYAVITTLALILILIAFRRIFPAMRRRIETSRGSMIGSVHLQRAELISAERVTQVLMQSVTVLRVGLVVLVLYLYITLLSTFFPLTRDYTPALLSYVLTPLQAVGSGFLAYLPSLLVIAAMAAFTYGCTRLSRFLFHHVASGAITWPGFYPEWADPTHKIVRFLILAFTAVVVFPYLPGSNSPAFRGISIFLGVLFSLGSTSAVANIVAGVILTYTRAFKIGDRVKIADTIGDVVESTLLVTRVRTIKNEVITVPNSMVLGAHITNFTSRSGGSYDLILHTSVTIGYDAPWRTVHDLLVAAALRTSHILPDPRPFVLQTSLDDFFVHYEINGYTDRPSEMANIYAELHRNIQDCFNDAGVEIMSPHYSSLRDGNRKAIPDDYLPGTYEAPFFRVGREKTHATQTAKADSPLGAR